MTSLASLLLVALLTPAFPQRAAHMFVLSEVARKSYGQYSLDFEQATLNVERHSTNREACKTEKELTEISSPRRLRVKGTDTDSSMGCRIESGETGILASDGPSEDRPIAHVDDPDGLHDSSRPVNITEDHVPTSELYGFLTPVSDLSGNQQSEVTSPQLEPVALPSVLDWLFDPGKSKSLADRVLARLVQLEAHEANTHFKSDYRQAWITLSFALKGIPDAFVQSSYAMYGIHPDKVWPSIVADRKARLGAEYHDFYDSADVLRPDVPKIPPTSSGQLKQSLVECLSVGSIAADLRERSIAQGCTPHEALSCPDSPTKESA